MRSPTRPTTTSRTWAAALAAALVATAIAGCGGGGTRASGNGDADPAAVIPQGAGAYVSITVRPQGTTKANVERMSRALFDEPDPGAAIVKLIDAQTTAGADLDFKKDIEPWLGKRVGAAIIPVSAGNTDVLVAAASADNAKAQDAIQKAGDLSHETTHQGVTIHSSPDGGKAAALLDDTVLFGSKLAVQEAIDAVRAKTTLSSLAGYQRARDKVPADGIAAAYVDVAKLVGTAAKAGGQGANAQLLQTLLGGQAQGIAAALQVGTDNLRLEAATVGGSGGAARAATGSGGAEAVAALPADAWLGLGIGDVGKSVDGILKGVEGAGGLGSIGVSAILGQVQSALGLRVREDLLAWMGSAGIFVQGTSKGRIGGGLIVHSKDPAATRRAVRRLSVTIPRLITSGRVGPLTGDGIDAGFTLSGGKRPTIALAAAGDRFILAVGTGALAAALKPGARLGGTAAFQDISAKLGNGQKPGFYLDMASVAKLVGAYGAAGRDTAKVLKVLSRFTQVAAGGRHEGNSSMITLVAGVNTQ